ncbi:hypothetical protein [Sandarakinorhabdus sp.]|uniref:hypothetical protein n=1 Tax=Sandarakinorhabdus sp. TaxID=1916663 RepID=UPI003F6EA9A1
MAMDAAMLADRPVRQGGRACKIGGSTVAMLVPKPPRQRARRQAVFATRRARLDFLDALAKFGDPALAAEVLQLSLVKLFRLRAEDAEFAAEWHAAIGFAWERVEHRVLAQMLDPAAAMDSKLALAIVARRDAGTAKVQGRRVDGAAVAKLRAELRALAGSEAVMTK